MKNRESILALTSTENMSLFAQYFQDNNIQWQHDAERFDLPYNIESYEQWVPVEKFSMFVDAIVEKTRDYNLGAKIGLRSSADLLRRYPELIQGNDAIESLATMILEHSAKISRHVTYWIEKVEGHWCLCLRGSLKPHFPGSAQIEWFRAALLISLCRNVLGQNWQPKQLYLTTTRSQGQQNEELFNSIQYHYNHRFCAFELPLPDSFTPLSFADKSMLSHYEEIQLLAATYAHIPTFSAEWLASLFGITRKTLYRYLAENGKTFREIKDEARFQTAKRLLSSTDNATDHIAYQLGYSDLANFERAFKRWSGMSAARFRKARRTD